MASRVMAARAFLVDRIRSGLAPGANVSVKLTAEALNMSHTPVREALERLVGEGVLVATRDRQGFAVPRLTIRELTGLHLLHGTLMLGLERPEGGRTKAWKPDRANPSAAVTQAIAQGCGRNVNAMVSAAVAAAELRLVIYRSVEPDVLPGWSAGLVRLRNGLFEGGDAAREAIAAFVGTRISHVEAILAAVEDMHAAAE